MRNLLKYLFKPSLFIQPKNNFHCNTARYSAVHNHVFRAMLKERKENEAQSLRNELKLGVDFTPAAWQDFRNRLLSRELRVADSYVNEKNVDAVIMRLCDDFNLPSVGQAFYNQLEKSNLTDGLLSRYLSLCAKDKEYALQNKTQVIDLYKKISQSECIEPSIAERCIRAVCRYESHWKEAFNLLSQVKLLSEPTASSYSFIIEACFVYGEPQQGWELLRYIAERRRGRPLPACYFGFFKYLTQLRDSKKFTVEHLEKLFYFLDEFHLNLPNIDVVRELESFITSLSDRTLKWSMRETFVSSFAVCRSCKRKLEPARLSSAEFNQLSTAFMRKVVMGNNVYIKSTPAELKAFTRFLEKALPYDIVIDGLNVAYSLGSRGHLLMAKALRSVVMHFVKNRQKVLVLGRIHMNRWSENVMRDVYSNAKVFLAQDLTQDDPLLLFAALRGGEHTSFISRDFMRSHEFALEEPSHKLLFRKWLVSHQYQLEYFDNSGRPVIQGPLPYSPSAQKLPLASTELCWHVPYELDFEILPADKREPPLKWLCIRRISEQQ